MPVLPSRIRFCSIVCCLRSRPRDPGGSHVGRQPPAVRPRRARRSADDAARAARSGRRRRPGRGYGLTPPRARGAVPASWLSELAGTVTFGSNASDPVPKAAYAAVFKAFTKATGIKVNVNTVDHNTFQEQINTYLQGRPQDVFTWFAGYRMQFFAQKGLLTPDRRRLGDAEAEVLARRCRPPRRASTGTTTSSRSTTIRGPSSTGRASSSSTATRSRRRGISSSRSPKKMKADGLTPLAFADKDGWPAMGTFDILNMRINGYDFHVRLMAGKESWDSAEGRRPSSTSGARCCRTPRRARSA